MKTGRLLLTVLLLAFATQGCIIFEYFADRQSIPLGDEPRRHHTPIYHHAGWTVARASIHNHTVYSDGYFTPEDLVELARREGMAILAITDHREGDLCIGGGPCLTFNGIEKVGYGAYFDYMDRLAAGTKDLLIMSGFEIAPYFFNSGKAPNFAIMHQNAHYTVYGLHDADVLDNMPVTRGFENVKPQLDQGTAPAQAFVDYVNAHGGYVHAVHLESYQDIWVGGIHATSPPRPSHLYEVRGLTGFSILPESSGIAGAPGGYWDAVMVEHLLGARSDHPWAAADADFHGPEGTLYRATTLFYMKEITGAEFYRCLREGLTVALQGEAFQDSYVTEFSIAGGEAAPDPIMFGQTVTLSVAPVIRFSLDHPVDKIKTRLIRNGKVIFETRESSFEYIDREAWDLNIPGVYRVEVAGPGQDSEEVERDNAETDPRSLLFVNPIFVYLKK